MSLEPAQIKIACNRHRNRGTGASADRLDIASMMKDALGVEEPDGELLVLPRSAHRDRNRLVHEQAPAAKTENDFERFLHSELIEIAVHSIFGAVPANAKVSNARGLHIPEFVALFPRLARN